MDGRAWGNVVFLTASALPNQTGPASLWANARKLTETTRGAGRIVGLFSQNIVSRPEMGDV